LFLPTKLLSYRAKLTLMMSLYYVRIYNPKLPVVENQIEHAAYTYDGGDGSVKGRTYRKIEGSLVVSSSRVRF
jgi:hypothetical protein